MPLPSNIILVGFMGSGKTVTGRAVAKITGVHFWDMDEWIQEKNNLTIPELFEKKGEAFFRQQERQAIMWLGRKKNYVASTGGGTWILKENREELLKMGWCVWLKVSPEDAWKRVGAHLEHRPLLSRSKDPRHTIELLLRKREPYYALAHIHIDTAGKDPRQAAQEIVNAFKEDRPLEPFPTPPIID